MMSVMYKTVMKSDDLHGSTLTRRFLNLLLVRCALTKCDESGNFVVNDNLWIDCEITTNF